jgi:hypothetical protein
MEDLRKDLAAAGTLFHVVVVNIIGGEPSLSALTSKGIFDCLQDVSSAKVWTLMGGGKDDMFVYRQGGRLAPGGYFPIAGPISSNLSTADGYKNLRDAIVAAAALGPADPCPVDPPAGGSRRPGDFNADGRLDITDPIGILMALFAGGTVTLPCEDTGLAAEGNRALLDGNSDGGVDISDAVYALDFLFLGGPAPGLGTACAPIPGCGDACRE